MQLRQYLINVKQIIGIEFTKLSTISLAWLS